VTSDVILIDLTLVKAGTRWELSTLRDRELEEKAIFIVQQNSLSMLGRFSLSIGRMRLCPESTPTMKGQLESHAGFCLSLRPRDQSPATGF